MCARACDCRRQHRTEVGTQDAARLIGPQRQLKYNFYGVSFRRNSCPTSSDCHLEWSLCVWRHSRHSAIASVRPIHCNHNNIIIGDVIWTHDASRPFEGRSKIVATVKRYNEVHIKLHAHQRTAARTYTVVFVHDIEPNENMELCWCEIKVSMRLFLRSRYFLLYGHVWPTLEPRENLHTNKHRRVNRRKEKRKRKRDRNTILIRIHSWYGCPFDGEKSTSTCHTR